MTDEENVKAIYPDAVSRPDVFGIQWEVHTKMGHKEWIRTPNTLLGLSPVSIEESWQFAWRDTQEKMLKILES
jgi:hypothetical protein